MIASESRNGNLQIRRRLHQIAEIHTNASESVEQRVETWQIAHRIRADKPVPDDGADTADLDKPTP
ncbi:hypothetical protein GCM10009827_084160 [Dactylosporangium maewongense]|uniref:Uncharacterized protein n=1 Tax=Dactylosporangium maewongense TaxID=634393 RepID=A0ABN2C0S8_9ACTN